MKINETGYAKPAGGVKKRGSVTSVGGFSDLLDVGGSDAPGAPSLSDVSATAALNNLLALQEISEEDIQRRKLQQQGNNMLDSLENLRSQLLSGVVPLATLQDLDRQLFIQKQFVSDPRLNEIIADIELRVAVERAKLQAAARHDKS